MPTASQRREDGRISAVIRSYQPSRIERELLAQVYDLANRGIEARSACAAQSPTLFEQVDNDLAAKSARCQIVDQFTYQHVDEMEVVA